MTGPAADLVVGVDLAAEPVKTAAAGIVWTPGRATLTELVLGATDTDVVRLAGTTAKIGIDCPLGWPLPYVAFLTALRDGAPIPPAATIEARRPLVYRTTDLRLMRDGLRPLSVAADRIGHAALRGAGLLAALGETDRSGRGRVVEVYPSATLRAWGLPHRRYKGTANLDALDASVDAVLAAAPWLDLGWYENACRRSDDAFDAVIAALAARAADLGRATLPDADDDAVARAEGWIALPTCGLADLPTA